MQRGRRSTAPRASTRLPQEDRPLDPLADFHPAVRSWFERRFPDGPTEPQQQGWPAIARGEDTLIAAPTGSGKTLSAFMVCIDRFYHEATRTSVGPLFGGGGATPGALAGQGPEEVPRGVDVVYVSPLKALAADIQQNLQGPLEEIARVAREQGHAIPDLQVAMRSGDTPASARASMLRRPPQILVTTPESLYLLVTAERSREILGRVRTVIVDEIHAVARDKRGSHLALTLERLDALCAERPTRIGLSATQRPIETVARLLVGAAPGRSDADGRPRCTIVDEGHRRALDIALQLPDTDLEAVASKEQMADVTDQIAELVRAHRTTLVFVNTRRMAERLAHELAERLGEGGVAAHHGSLSKERRLKVEARLRAGELQALVATASLELGIDIGPIELVCQVGSPRSLATFLQRVGRSGHYRGGTPKGRLFPTSRDELVECAALLRGVKAGRLDAVHPPSAPLDILAQQIVAACAAGEWEEDALYALMCGAAPFASLERGDFDAVVDMLSEGITTGRGRRAAYLHRDRVNGVLRGRRGARLAALTSGGAIPEVADYRVIADPDETFVGTVDEDFAVESMPGNIFLLGSTSWRIRRVESGVVRVSDAGGAPPNIPFWMGEAPSRTAELSEEVSALRQGVAARLEGNASSGRGQAEQALVWLESECGLERTASQQIVGYLGASFTALGGMPSADELIFERFFDEAGGTQLVIHSPLGGRINRALCLALRKKFCRSFNFELQAAASDDALVLSLGPHHSFPLEGVPRYLASSSVEDTLEQAVLASPLMNTRWRWNLNRSLAVLRFKGGKRNPPPIQRMEADDLMAAVFPSQAACQENVSYPIEIPDHPLVRQTMHDCLHEAMDVDGLRALVERFEQGTIRLRFVETTEASPLSHEILNGRPYTYLDDAPLEERRTRAVALRRGLPVEARELAKLDPEAIERVRDEARPAPRDAEELHDWLLTLTWMRPAAELRGHFEELVQTGRACRALSGGGEERWCAIERRRAVEAIRSDVRFAPDTRLPAALAALPAPAPEAALRELVRGYMECVGPISAAALGRLVGIAESSAEIALAELEAEGGVFRGHFEERPGEATASGVVADEYCSRRLLTRIHRYTQDRLRKEIEPVTARDFIRFLLRWQHVATGARCEGQRGVADVMEQLQGFEVAVGAWEESVLAARVQGYQPRWLDSLCLSGDLCWGRLSPRAEGSSPRAEGSPPRAEGSPPRAEGSSPRAEGSSPRAEGSRPRAEGALPHPEGSTRRADAQASDAEPGGAARAAASPSRATPMAFALRADLGWLLQAHGGEPRSEAFGAGAARDILESLRREGALFHSDLVARLSRLPVEVEEGLWALVARGWVTADGFQAVRSLLGARERWARTRARERARRGLRRGLRRGGAEGAAEGRWSLLPGAEPVEDADALAEALAEQLLARWGVLFRELTTRENLAVPWRDIVWALRRMEARGLIRGGRFVAGFAGEQYALPEAVDSLRRVRRSERSGEVVRLSAVDPLNLVGILTPGARVPALRTNEVVYLDGLPVSEEELRETAASPAVAPI